MQAVQASQDGAQLARRPAASLGCACRGRERRVDRIDIDGKINRPVANCLADLLDDPRRTDGVNFASLDTLEPRLIVILIVRRARKCRADRAML